MSRRNAKERPARRTRCSMLSVVEALEPRAMLAGVGPESWSTAGPTFGPLGAGPASSSGALLTCSSPTPGSSGSSSPPAPTAGTGGTQSTGLALPSNSGSGAGSSPTGSGSNNSGGLALPCNSGSGTGSSSTGSGSSNTGGLALPSNSGSGTGSSPTGSGSSNAGGLALPSNSGSGAGSSNSGTGSNSDPNSPVLSAQYTGGSTAGGQGTGTSTGSGGNLWLLYGAGSGAGSFSSGGTGGSTSTSQSPGSGGTLTTADLWSSYGTGIGAGSSSGTSNGSSTDGPILSAKYTGGSGGGQDTTAATFIPGGLVHFVTGAAGADAAGSGNPQGSTGSTTLALADSQSAPTITPLVYQPSSDDGAVFVTAVWTGDDGGWQVVQAAEMESDIAEPFPITTRAESTATYHTPIIIGHGLWPFPQVFRVPPESNATYTAETDGSWVSSDEVEPLVVNGKPYVRLDGKPVMRPVMVWVPGRPRDANAWTDNAGQKWKTDQGEISAYGVPPSAPTMSQVAEACGSVLAAFLGRRAGRAIPRINQQKQAGHLPGTPQYSNRTAQGKPTSAFFGDQSGEIATRIAEERGVPVPGRPNVKEYNFGIGIGTGPNGGIQTRVRVHTSPSTGEIHGHPSGPETF